MLINVSNYPIALTARTNELRAIERSLNLYLMGCKNVIELCCGPSLQTLERAYKAYGIEVTGNDIESRYKASYKQGKWLIGDRFYIDVNQFDCVVFAPPLTKGCSGKRDDALMIEDVNPSHYDAIKTFKSKNLVLTLPARSLATSCDRAQLYKLKAYCEINYSKVELIELKNKGITKYVDIYCEC